MSISNLLSENTIELYLNVNENGLKISNIPNDTTTTLQSNSLNNYTLVLPKKADNVNDILAVDFVNGENVFLKWVSTTGNIPPTLPFDTINCNILNANNEVNTNELTISSPFGSINTTFIQPEGDNETFNVKLFLPKDAVSILNNDSVLYVDSSVLVPGTPDTFELNLSYTKTLPEFNIDLFTTSNLTFSNNTNKTTSIVASDSQVDDTITLVLPTLSPNLDEILVAGENGLLFWANPTNVIEKFLIFNYKQTVNQNLNNDVPVYISSIFNWIPSNTNPELIWQVYVNYQITKTNSTGSFTSTQSVKIANNTYTLVAGSSSKPLLLSETNTVIDEYSFFIKNIIAPTIPIEFSVSTNISQGGTLLISSFSITIVPIGIIP